MLRLFLAVLAISLVTVPAAHALDLTGALTTPEANGLDGTGAWATGSSLAWEVTPGSGFYTYHYTFSVPVGEVSHFILQTSSSFTIDDIIGGIDGVTFLQGSFDGYSFDTWAQSGSNPGMPDSFYGIKFDNTTGTTIEFTFDSERRPIEGSFFAKDGNAGGMGKNALWNSGLDPEATDPQFIVVPDTDTDDTPDPQIPEASAALLAMPGLGILGILRRRLR